MSAEAVIQTMRPQQWVKNVFVLAPLIFAHQLVDLWALLMAASAFAVFCAASSSVYMINDVVDREFDRLHPTKRDRPVASGALPVPRAIVVALLLAAASVGGAWAVGVSFLAVVATYLLMNLAYSIQLKNVVILDVIVVAAGFLLRTWGGALAIRVEMSRWLVLCTGLIALFMGFVKRRQEIAALGANAEQRPILREYSLPFLDQLIGIVTASTVLAYSLYAMSDEVAEKLGTHWMGLTIPFVLFGIFRYLYLVHRRGQGANPTTLVLSDGPLILNVLAWGITVLLVLYVL